MSGAEVSVSDVKKWLKHSDAKSKQLKDGEPDPSWDEEAIAQVSWQLNNWRHPPDETKADSQEELWRDALDAAATLQRVLPDLINQKRLDPADISGERDRKLALVLALLQEQLPSVLRERRHAYAMKVEMLLHYWERITGEKATSHRSSPGIKFAHAALERIGVTSMVTTEALAVAVQRTNGRIRPLGHPPVPPIRWEMPLVLRLHAAIRRRVTQPT
jgi:hypothetical protein